MLWLTASRGHFVSFFVCLPPISFNSYHISWFDWIHFLFCGHNLCNSLICSWAWWAFPLRLWLLPVRVNKVAITQVQSPFPPSVALLRLQLLVSPAQPSAATETKDRGGELGQNFLNPTEHCLPCRTLLPLGDVQKGKARIWTQFSQLHQLYANE